MITGGEKNQSESKNCCLRKWFRSICGSTAVFFILQVFWTTREEYTCQTLAWPTFPIGWACLAPRSRSASLWKPPAFPPRYPLGNLLMTYWDARGNALMQGKSFVCDKKNWPSHPVVKFLQCYVDAQRLDSACIPTIGRTCMSAGTLGVARTAATLA